jgi:hypothetical protein
LYQEWDIEIYQQPYLFLRQLQVRQELGLMDRQQFFHGFQFQDDFVLYEKIDLVAAIELQAFVIDGQVHLPLKAQSAQVKLMAKTLLVSRFQKPRTKVPMNLNRRPDNRTRPRVPRLFALFPRRYMNRMESFAHRTISSRNQGNAEKNDQVPSAHVP